MKILIALIVLTFGFSTAIKIDCEYKYVRNPERSNFLRYKCYLRSIIFEDDETRTITSLTEQQHQPNQTVDQVTMFHSDKNIFKRFPRNIVSYFKNIEMVDVYESNLSEITKEDLKQFGDKLKILFLIRNRLRTLYSDLFSYTPNIEWINFSENTILHVDVGTFTPLTHLKKLYFSHNACYQGTAATDESLKQLIASIYQNCQNINVVTSESASLTQANQNIVNVNNQLNSNTTVLKNSIEAREKSIKKLREDGDKVNTENAKKIDDLKLEKARFEKKCIERDEVVKSVKEMIDSMKQNMKSICVLAPTTTTPAPVAAAKP